MRLVTLVLCTAAAVGAAGIQGPISGFVFDPGSRSIRPLNGMPGSATQGDGLPLPFPVGLAAISTRQDFALITDAGGDGTPVLATGLRSGTPQIASMDGVIAADGIVLNESGDTAALYSNASSRIQFITGLPGQPKAEAPIDASGLTGGVAAMALDSAGANAALAAGDGGIFWIPGRASLNRITGVPGASSVAFLGGDVIAASRTTGDVLRIQDPGGSASISTLAGAQNGITAAAAVRAINASEVGVVDGTGRLAAIDVNSSAVTWIDLAGAADRIETLDRSLLILNRTGTQPLLVLDTSNGRTAFFIPPVSVPDSQVQ